MSTSITLPRLLLLALAGGSIIFFVDRPISLEAEDVENRSEIALARRSLPSLRPSSSINVEDVENRTEDTLAQRPLPSLRPSSSIGVEVDNRTVWQEVRGHGGEPMNQWLFSAEEARAQTPLPSLQAIAGTPKHDCSLRSIHVSLEPVHEHLQPAPTDSDAIIDKCEGYLIRDDIILTTRACSRFAFHFVTADGKEKQVYATPHTELNHAAHRSLDERIGFLSAHVPHHYQFLSQPVRRARAFLSSVGSNSASEIKCDETTGKPLIHHIEVGGQQVLLGHLRSVLPDDVLWDEDLKTAVEFSDRSGQLRWYARPTTKSNETKRMFHFFGKYSGPYGSFDIVRAQSKFEKKCAAVTEAEDPKGHRWLCHRYFVHYWREEPFSGMTYFDWLDYSDQGRSYYIDKKPKEICSDKWMSVR